MATVRRNVIIVLEVGEMGPEGTWLHEQLHMLLSEAPVLLFAVNTMGLVVYWEGAGLKEPRPGIGSSIFATDRRQPAYSPGGRPPRRHAHRGRQVRVGSRRS